MRGLHRGDGPPGFAPHLSDYMVQIRTDLSRSAMPLAGQVADTFTTGAPTFTGRQVSVAFNVTNSLTTPAHA